MARFFFAAAVWGRLCLRDIPDHEPWNAARLIYWDEIYLDGVSRLALAGQKIRTTSELDDAVTASAASPGIRPLWVREDRLQDTRRHWEIARPGGRWRRPASAAPIAAVAVLASVLAVILAGGHGPEPLVSPSPRAVTARPAASTGAAPRLAASAGAAPVPLIVRGPMRRVHRTAYAVRVGTFSTTAAAEQMKTVVLSKGYVVLVVRRGALSEVVTPLYRTRAQAERVLHGLAGIGLSEQLTTWRVQ